MFKRFACCLMGFAAWGVFAADAVHVGTNSRWYRGRDCTLYIANIQRLPVTPFEDYHRFTVSA